MRFTLLFLGLLTATVSTGCIRSYNTTPLSIVNLDSTLTTANGLELRTKAFVTPAEIYDKFGVQLAGDSMVIPVQVLVTNQGLAPYRVLRNSFVLEATDQKIRLAALNFDEMYRVGSLDYTGPILGVLFGGPLGLPSLWTTLYANDKLHDDYERKIFRDSFLAPGESARGVLFFDLRGRDLSRHDKYRLLVEFENMETHAKTVARQALY